jgi:hypothetical protein
MKQACKTCEKEYKKTKNEQKRGSHRIIGQVRGDRSFYMKKTILSVVVFYYAFSTLWAQTDSVAVSELERFIHNIQIFNRLVPQEKVYLHFDNISYVQGETIWFKAYVVTAVQNLPTTQSGVLYVELLNAKGKRLETKKLKIEDGQCHGEFSLNTLNMDYFPGFYEVRAYTEGMLNFGEETVFSRVFPVFEKSKADGDYTEQDLKDGLDISLPNHRPKQKNRKNVHVDFYPEGGNLVNGLTSSIAFKATDKHGQNIEIEGEICNPEGEILTTFNTLHAGMGLFPYLPDGKKNRINVFYENKKYTFDFPQSLVKGYILQVNNFSKNTLMVQIDKSPEMSQSPLGLSILCRGEVSFFQEIAFDSESCMLKIPKEILTGGVNQITLFDDKGKILAERLLFIYPKEEEQVFIVATPDKTEYRPLEKINIDLSLTGNTGNIGNASHPETTFSLAVRDAVNSVKTNPGNIFTNLLLSSDLKGFIENPDYYFDSANSNRIQAMDVLMMVQGWKRYEWQAMAGVKPFKQLYSVEKGLTVKGIVPGSEGKNIEIIAKMQSKDNRQQMDGTVLTDNKGVFYIYPEDFYGTWSLNLRSRVLKNGNKKIRLDRWFSPAPKMYSLHEMTWKNNDGQSFEEESDDSPLQSINSDNDSISKMYLIREVQVQTKRKKDIVYNIGADLDRLLDVGEKAPYNVHDYLQENDYLYKYKPLDSLMNSFGTKQEDNFEGDFLDNNFYDSRYGNFLYNERYAKFYYLASDGKWMTYSDPQPVSLKKIAVRYDMVQPAISLTAKRIGLEIEKIVISGFDKTDDFGERHIPIYIYPYDNFMMRSLSGIRYTFFDGYSKAQDFFGNQADGEDALPDEYGHQRTLYWNSDIKTDGEGKASISFFNTGLRRKIDISAEGLTKNGIPVVTK